MGTTVKAVPDGFHTVTPHLVLNDTPKAIDFYKRAFGAEEKCRMPGPDGRIMHAQIRIGSSEVFLADEHVDWGGPPSPLALGNSPVSLHLYVDDVDAVFDRAVAAGATVAMPVQDMFWGDRYGKVIDPFGHHWSLASHKEDLTAEQMQERSAAAFAGGICEPASA